MYLLELAGVGTPGGKTGWGIFVSREPASPDTVITLYDTGGFEPLYNGGVQHPTIQARIRGAPNGYPQAYAKAQEVRTILLQSDGVVYNNTTYYFWLQGELTFLEYDENSRPIFVINFRLMRRGM